MEIPIDIIYIISAINFFKSILKNNKASNANINDMVEFHKIISKIYKK